MLGNVPGAQRLVEELSDEEEATFVTNQNFNKTKLVLAPGDLCRKCTAAVNIGGGDTSGHCAGVFDTMGCSGYQGHPPASRPQGRNIKKCKLLTFIRNS